MLWLIVIVLVVGMLFVMTHKPRINAAGAQWVPPEQRVMPKPIEVVTPTRSDATPAQAPVASTTPDTFDFNDLYAPKSSGPTDRPRA